jgi:predicted phage tail protein
VYTFTVYAVDTAGNKSAGADVTATPVLPDLAPPADVRDPAATPGDGGVTLNWTDPPDADLDHIEISRDGGSPETVAKWTRTYTVTGLSNGTTYTFTIRAVDATGNKSAGVSVTATLVRDMSDITKYLNDASGGTDDNPVTLYWRAMNLTVIKVM